MYAVGSDRIALLAKGIGPAAPAHAVDLDGDLLCREERPRYHFPARDWVNALTPNEACSECAAIALERALPAAAVDDPYPTAAPAAAATVVAPSQPAIDWLRFPQDFSVWSDSL